MNRRYLIAIAAGAAFMGVLLTLLLLRDNVPSQEPSQNALDITLPDLNGEPHNLREWTGQVVLVNFWASWCAPCREELPLLIEIQNVYGPDGFTVLGIAIDETDKAGDLARTLAINYPVLVAAEDGIEHSRALGNEQGVLPFSILLDRDGRVVSRHSGVLEREELESTLAPLL